jgi:hypothetical protein
MIFAEGSHGQSTVASKWLCMRKLRSIKLPMLALAVIPTSARQPLSRRLSGASREAGPPSLVWPCCRRTVKRGYEFPPSYADCHLPPIGHARCKVAKSITPPIGTSVPDFTVARRRNGLLLLLRLRAAEVGPFLPRRSSTFESVIGGIAAAPFIRAAACSAGSSRHRTWLAAPEKALKGR